MIMTWSLHRTDENHSSIKTLAYLSFFILYLASLAIAQKCKYQTMNLRNMHEFYYSQPHNAKKKLSTWFSFSNTGDRDADINIFKHKNPSTIAIFVCTNWNMYNKFVNVGRRFLWTKKSSCRKRSLCLEWLRWYAKKKKKRQNLARQWQRRIARRTHKHNTGEHNKFFVCLNSFAVPTADVCCFLYVEKLCEMQKATK